MGQPSNEEILKAIDLANISGGELNEEQQIKFIEMVKEKTVLMKNCRLEVVDNPKGELAKLFIGEPITRQAPSSGTAPSTGEAAVTGNHVDYSTTKLISYYDLPMDVVRRNIAKGKFEDLLMNMVSRRIGNDVELLGIRGDATAYSAVNTPLGYLLRTMDGWMYKAQSAHVVDLAGSSVSMGVFTKMYRNLPDEYKGDPGLRWIMPETIKTDWLDLIADRATSGGDAAMGGKSINPCGIPILAVPQMASNKSVNISTASPATIIGTRIGPFVTSSTEKALKIDIDNAGAVTITLTVGVLETLSVVAAINAAMGATVAYDSEGRILLQSTTTGSASEIDIQSVSSDAYTVVGFTAAVTTGHALGGTGHVLEGSNIMLCNPENLIAVLLGKTRFYSEFEARKDSIEVTAYNEVDFIIENLDALVLADNLRLRTL